MAGFWELPGGEKKRRQRRSRRSRLPALLGLGTTLCLLLVLFAAALVYLRPESSGRRLSLTDVITATLDKRVTDVRLLDEDARITGTFVSQEGEAPVAFWTSYPKSDAVTNDLMETFFANGTNATVDSQSGKSMVRMLAQFPLPLLILTNLVGLLYLVGRTGGGRDHRRRASFDGGAEAVAAGTATGVTFADVAGAEDAVAELSDVRDSLVDASSFDRLGAVALRGVLLVGPPGCGKALLARALAGEADAQLFSVSASELVAATASGVGAVADLFREARSAQPAVVLIRDLESIGSARASPSGNDDGEAVAAELLRQMDGLSTDERVVVLAATTRLDVVDPSITGPGRFERLITIDRPDLTGRLAILRLHARSKQFADADVDLADIAAATPGFSGADLSNVVNEAARLAVRERAGAVERRHLEEAVERVVAGPRSGTVVLSVEDRRRLACHEAGHAVVAASLGRSPALQKVSITPRARGVGHLPTLGEDRAIPTLEDMEAEIAVALGGMAAEEMVFDEPSTACEADLETATKAARDIAGRFGMSEELGRARFLDGRADAPTPPAARPASPVSQRTLERLDAEVRRILDEQEEFARKTLYANRNAVAELASLLASQETVAGPELSSILVGVTAAQYESAGADDDMAPYRPGPPVATSRPLDEPGGLL